jgi:hypothetical protein
MGQSLGPPVRGDERVEKLASSMGFLHTLLRGLWVGTGSDKIMGSSDA